MTAVVLVYLGLAGNVVALASLVWPLKFLGIASRRSAAILLIASIVTLIIGSTLPASEVRVRLSQTELDRWMPVYQFHEVHSVRIAASQEHAYRALQEVTAEEISFYRTLVWTRRLGRPGPPSMLNPPPDEPLLELAARTGFLTLSQLNHQELVMGTLVAVPRGWRPSGPPTVQGYKTLAGWNQPGFAFAAINFRFESCSSPSTASPCTLLTTETRIYATDLSTRRRFARYWRVIFPGSALIRIMWLRAAARRAEAI